MHAAAVNALRPWAKVGIIIVGLIIALAAAWVAVELHQQTMRVVDPQGFNGGMQAFGDLLLGLAVFGGVALVPLGLALYWLRSLARFWSVLVGIALSFSATGLLALCAQVVAGQFQNMWLFLALARIGVMPLSALAFLIAAAFAPQPRQRWLLLVAAATEGIIFVGFVLVKFVLPSLGRG